MGVHDLNSRQMEELKSVFFWGDETMSLVPEDVWNAEDIPDEVIFEHYAGIDFVDNDFFCSFCDNIPASIPF